MTLFPSSEEGVVSLLGRAVREKRYIWVAICRLIFSTIHGYERQATIIYRGGGGDDHHPARTRRRINPHQQEKEVV